MSFYVCAWVITKKMNKTIYAYYIYIYLLTIKSQVIMYISAKVKQITYVSTFLLLNNQTFFTKTSKISYLCISIKIREIVIHFF